MIKKRLMLCMAQKCGCQKIGCEFKCPCIVNIYTYPITLKLISLEMALLLLRFVTSFSVGYIGAIIAALYNIFIILPSSVSTIMQFRSGALPSLRDMKDFKQYRTNILQATTLLGGKVTLCHISFVSFHLLLPFPHD